MDNQEREGVIKFQLEFRPSEPVDHPIVLEIESWRRKMLPLGLIGQDPNRYEGLGFGNISHRVHFPGHHNAFVISGTQTGHLDLMSGDHYAIVTHCDAAKNHIWAQGPIKPSSEAMTHAVIYQKIADAEAIIHIHSPDIWRRAVQLDVAITDPKVTYGTPQMATEMERLIDSGAVTDNIISMTGHEDGVICWGRTIEEAGEIVLALYKRARLDEEGVSE